MKWTPEAKESALRAQAEYGDDVEVATVERAEEIALPGGYDLVDTDIWFQALLDVRLPRLDSRHEMAS